MVMLCRRTFPGTENPRRVWEIKGSGFSADDVSRFILDFVLEGLMPVPSFWLCVCVCTSAKGSGVRWSSSTAVLVQLVGLAG